MTPAPSKSKAGRRIVLLWLLLASVAALLRVALALHPGLWVDELFSLAMATGHSLEHPANEANAALGDFIEPPDPQPASKFRAYLEHDTPPAGLSRVIRAVQLSDTSPPLYYLVLNVWTRIFGSSDAALHLFSVVCALACLPLLWFLGFDLGGERTAWASCVFFTFSPVALYYAAEGRMYSLTWFIAIFLVWATLALSTRGPRPHLLILWVLSAGSGLLTHYFLAFVLAACVAWMLFYPNKMSRLHWAGLIAIAVLLVFPWYLHLPESLSRWRVTGGWLNHPLTWKAAIVNPVKLVWSYLSVSGIWGGSRGDIPALGVYAFLLLLALRLGIGRLFIERWRLVWLWVLGSTLGPVVFDLLRGTDSSSIARYALPGLPAGILLLAMGTSMLPRKAYAAFLILLPLIWLPGVRKIYLEPRRYWEPLQQVASHLNAWAEPQDLIIVHSIPSGVLGVARYLEAPTPIASWVVQLKQRRIPDDMYKIIAFRRRVALAMIHDLGEPSPAQEWLSQHWKLERDWKVEHSDPKVSKNEVLYFVRELP